MATTDTMKAVLLTGHGGLDKLEYREDVPKPRPGPGEVLIRVHACGLNNTDVNTRIAWYSAKVEEGVTESSALGGDEAAMDAGAGDDGGWSGALGFPRIQGADVCGVVEEVGEMSEAEASALLGKRVLVDPWLLDAHAPDDLAKARFYGSETDGGFADYAIAPVGNVHAVESDYTDAELATFACAYVTAENLMRRTAPAAGERVVISGASGGVGSAAVQLAKLRGARVIALAANSKAEAVAALGADEVVNSRDPQLGAALQTALRSIGAGEADAAVDVVGGDTFPILIDCLRRGGRYACSGAIGGPMVGLDLRKLILRDLQLSGATTPPAGTFARVVDYIETRQLRPLLAQTFPLRDLAEAQRAFIAKQYVGNIVVTMDVD